MFRSQDIYIFVFLWESTDFKICDITIGIAT